MNKTCRFKDCGAYGHINNNSVETPNGGLFILNWCSKCGRVQNKFI